MPTQTAIPAASLGYTPSGTPSTHGEQMGETLAANTVLSHCHTLFSIGVGGMGAVDGAEGARYWGGRSR
jgi:hypothetical protein